MAVSTTQKFRWNINHFWKLSFNYHKVIIYYMTMCMCVQYIHVLFWSLLPPTSYQMSFSACLCLFFCLIFLFIYICIYLYCIMIKSVDTCWKRLLVMSYHACLSLTAQTLCAWLWKHPSHKRSCVLFFAPGCVCVCYVRSHTTHTVILAGEASAAVLGAVGADV